MKLVKIRSLKHPEPHINWDFQAEDPQAKIDELLDSGVCGLPERPELDERGHETGVILPAEYTIEIEDISQEHALKEVIAKRIAEYPSPAEFLNSYFDGGLDLLREKRLAVKAKYPKP